MHNSNSKPRRQNSPVANAARQARFAEHQRAMGRLARKIWATDAEAAALRKYLEELREAEREREQQTQKPKPGVESR